MFLTRALLAAATQKYSLVVIQSTVSGHKYEVVREKKSEKLELICFDPLIRKEVVYKETRRIKGVDMRSFNPPY